jgi:hypothetical protein
VGADDVPIIGEDEAAPDDEVLRRVRGWLAAAGRASPAPHGSPSKGLEPMDRIDRCLEGARALAREEDHTITLAGRMPGSVLIELEGPDGAGDQRRFVVYPTEDGRVEAVAEIRSAEDRVIAGEVLGLEVHRSGTRSLATRMSGTVDGLGVSIVWVPGGERTRPATVFRVGVPTGALPAGFEATRAAEPTGWFGRIVLGKRNVAPPEGKPLVVKAHGRRRLSAWLTPDRVGVLSRTGADYVGERGLARKVRGHLSSPHEIVTIAQDLISTAGGLSDGNG